MASSETGRPLDILTASLKKTVTVRLKGGREFSGELNGYDLHMNIVLDNAEELRRNAETGSYESVKKYSSLVLRGDNVVYVAVRD